MKPLRAETSGTPDRAFGVILVFGCALAACHMLMLPRITVDDAFISFRYAQHLVEGRGLVFNPGERVEGYSNLSWVLLTAVGLLVAADPIAWTRSLGAASMLGIIVASAFLIRRLMRSNVAVLVTVVLLSTSTALAASSLSGLETGLYGFLVTAAAAALSYDRHATASLLLGFAALTRPEGAGLCLVAVAVVLASQSPGCRVAAIRLALPAFVMIGGLFAFRLTYYGHLLPNSVIAKSAMMTRLHNAVWTDWPGILLNSPGIGYVSDYLRHTFGLVACLAVMPVFQKDRFLLTARTLFAFIVMGFAVAISNFGDWMSSFRLLTPYLGCLTVLVVAGAGVLLGVIDRRLPEWRVPLRVVAVSIAVLCAARQFQTERPRASGSPDLQIAEILSRSKQPGLLATTDVLGRLGYYSGSVPIIDMAGLTDEHIALHGEPRPPFGRSDFGYVLSRHPHFIMNNVRSAWHRHLVRSEFVERYFWVDRTAWTNSRAAAGKPRYVFVAKGSTLEREIRHQFPDADFRTPMDLKHPSIDDRRVARNVSDR